jgi:hypothetical protein
LIISALFSLFFLYLIAYHCVAYKGSTVCMFLNKKLKKMLLLYKGGWLALKFGTKIVIGSCILISSIFTLLLPLAARVHVFFLIACRFTIGLAHVNKFIL